MSRKPVKSAKKSNHLSPPVDESSLNTRMQLLGFLRGDSDQEALLADMQVVQSLNQKLNELLIVVKQCPSGSAEEDIYMARVEALQDERFQLLSKMRGNRVNDYQLLAAL